MISLHKMPFVVPLLASCLGIIADRLFGGSVFFWTILASVTIGCALVSAYYRLSLPTIIFLFAATASSFAGWHHIHWSIFPASEISRFAPKESAISIPVVLDVTAIQQPKLIRVETEDPLSTIPGNDRTRLTVRVLRIRNGQTWSTVTGKADMVVEGHLLGANAGDRLRVFASLKRTASPLNPGERDFRVFKRADRKLCHLHVPYPDCVSVLSLKKRGGMLAALQRFRGRCHASLDQYISEPHRPLAAALFLGLRDSMPSEQTEAFFLTGTMHLLAISGLHVGILACGFFFAARRGWVPFQASLLALVFFVVGYALLTEARPPVLRATILILILCLSWLMRRRPHAFNSLAVAGIVVLLLNPADLFRIGTQLSFLAVATLSWFGMVSVVRPPEDPLDRLIWRTRSSFVKIWHAVRDTVTRMFLASLCVWSMTLPLTMSEFHLVSPLAIVLNVVLFIPVAVALFSGMAVITFGQLIPPLASLAGSVCSLSLDSMQTIVDGARALPFSHLWVAGMHGFWTAIFYVGVIVAVLIIRPKFRWGVLLLFAWFAIPTIFHAGISKFKHPVLECTFVAVGHGTCVLLELPDGRTLLYDCGHLGIARSAVESISAVLWSKSISHLDAVVLSHADADHYNALPGLLERFSAGIVYTGPDMFDSKSESLQIVKESIQQSGIESREIEAGCIFRTTDVAKLIIRHPYKDLEYSSDNAKSLVLSVEYGPWTIVLPGDIERDGLEGLISQPAVDTDLIMAPHHGSMNSQPQRFVDWSAPEWSVISSMLRPDTSASIAAYAGEKRRVYHTGLHGAVFVQMSLDRLGVDSFLRHDGFPQQEE